MGIKVLPTKLHEGFTAEHPDMKLTATEFTVLRAYVDDNYLKLNLPLRQGGFSKWENGVETVKPFNPKAKTTRNLSAAVTVMDSALSKMPVYQGEVTRVARSEGDKLAKALEALKPGATVTDPGYVSASQGGAVHENLTMGKANLTFRINSLSGRDVAHKYLVAHPEEKEVIFPRNTTFRVRSVEKTRDEVPHTSYRRGEPAEYLVHLDEVPRPTANLAANAQEWRFQSSASKVRLFQDWLKERFDSDLRGKAVESLWQRYVEEGFRKGAGRAYDDLNKSDKARSLADDDTRTFYEGSRDQFLRSSFRQPESVETIKLLAGRSYTDLEGVTAEMSTKMTRTLTDGLVQGKSPREIGKDLDDALDLGERRAETIARTEIIRAHAEGQLTAFKALGVEELGVEVEWSTSDDEKVCPQCSTLEGIVIPIEDAHGMLPRHPNCRCAWIPANVGESEKGQKRDEDAEDAIAEADEL